MLYSSHEDLSFNSTMQWGYTYPKGDLSCFFFSVLRIELVASHMIGKRSTKELYS